MSLWEKREKRPLVENGARLAQTVEKMAVAKHLGGLLFQDVEVQLVAQCLDQRRC